MSFITVAVIAAVLSTVVALVAGITSMVTDARVGHLEGKQWMVRRVAFQGVAFVAVMLAIYMAS